MVRIALDTNVFVYAEGVNGEGRKKTAIRLLKDIGGDQEVVIPVQALSELFTVLTRKAQWPAAAARAAVPRLERCLRAGGNLVRRAAGRHGTGCRAPLRLMGRHHAGSRSAGRVPPSVVGGHAGRLHLAWGDDPQSLFGIVLTHHAERCTGAFPCALLLAPE